MPQFPKGYTLSPFSQPPADIAPIIEKSLNPAVQANAVVDGPKEAGYCEMCGENFVDPAIHRKSAQHQAAANSNKWDEFDRISSEINDL